MQSYPASTDAHLDRVAPAGGAKVPAGNPRLSAAYRQFNWERSRRLNEALILAGWNPPRHFPYRPDEKPVLPSITEELQPLRPLALKVVREPAYSQKEVLSKLMVLTHMCPDLPELHKAMAALFGTGNRAQALKHLATCLEAQPKGARLIAVIKRELEVAS